MNTKHKHSFLFLMIPLVLSGCQSQTPAVQQPSQSATPVSDTVHLTVWGAEEDEELLRQIISGFEAEYGGQADFDITYTPQSEGHCTDALMADLENGADVFAFADDQLSTLVAAGALEPVNNPATVMETSLHEAVLAASVNDTIYALPLTADNGYFLYYNKDYFTEEDILSLDKMLSIAAGQDKKVSMEWSSGWYVYALFGNTGLTVGLNDDGMTNYCTWNAVDGSIKGVDVAQSMMDIASHPGFVSTDDAGFVEGVQNGQIIAGINGVWNAVTVEKVRGSKTSFLHLRRTAGTDGLLLRLQAHRRQRLLQGKTVGIKACRVDYKRGEPKTPLPDARSGPCQHQCRRLRGSTELPCDHCPARTV